MALRKGGGGAGGNFLNLLQKEGDTQKGEIPSKYEGGIPTLEETMNICFFKNYASSATLCLYIICFFKNYASSVT